ncbi:EpsG family protein [Priestia aryabhattai]|uniref:EpsG family protein n=1 Tax=Priestia aryabhattai TaxID=412384 RepID=UPI003D2CAE46
MFSLLSLINSKFNRVFYFLLWFILLLVAGLRYNVGTDYLNYERAYNNSDFWFSEIGFIWISKVMKYLGFSSQLYFFAIALLIQVLVFKSLKKYTENSRVFYLSIFFFITLYYFNHSMNTLRQFIAIGIFMLNVENIIKRNFLKYNFFFIVAFLFHTSSIVFYPLYFLCKMSNKVIHMPKIRNALLIISFALMFVRFDGLIQNLVLKYASDYTYVYYATWGADSYIAYDLSWQMMLVLVSKFILSLWIINNINVFTNTRTQKVIFNIFFIGLILTFPLYPMLIFRRFLFYINIFEIIVYAIFAHANKRAFFLFVIYAIIFFIVNLLSGFSAPLPYTIRIFGN